MMSSSDSGCGQSLSTPSKVQKQLFGSSAGSSKRNLFQTDISAKRDDGLSGEESDLGPMSPLDMSDNGSNASSLGREYNSPFATPEKSPKKLDLTWDRLRPSSSSRKSSGLSPFSSLKKLTRDARSSPRRIICPHSPKSSALSPSKKNLENYIPASPSQIELESYIDDVIPETPPKDCVVKSQHKENCPERKLITPLGSVCKDISIPPLHRRKSICPFDSSEESPERRDSSVKRHASDVFNMGSIKVIKIDDGSFIPKARASLFQEDRNNIPKLPTLSTKSFYNCTTESKRRSFAFGWRPLETETKKRKSLPLNSHHRRSTGSAKQQKLTGINSGVKHNIKRPKLKRKRHSLTTPAQENNQSMLSETNENIPVDSNVSCPITLHDIQLKTSLEQLPPPAPIPRAPSPVEDPNKRFFRTNRTIKINREATITVNGNIKLKVADGKIALNQKKRPVQHLTKKPKLEKIVLDATDLTVDEPTFNTTVNQDDVAELLRVLEDDWADDEYDVLEKLSASGPIVRSPSKCSRVTDDMLLSPTSILSNMTSSMNIEDQNGANNKETISNQICENFEENSTKLYPIFSKGYTSNLLEPSNEKKPRGVKRPANWQLSTKINGDNHQYQLDAGQKRFGTVQCDECNVVYQVGEPEDENAHLIYHNGFKTLRFNGWKNERVVYQHPFTGSRIITIEATDPKHHWKKVEEVLSVVDKDLGLNDIQLPNCNGKKIYLYIRDKNIIGVLVAETVKVAHRMIPELFELDCCSEESSPVKCGVNVIWTAMTHRRQGIAKKMLDILRSNYYFGYIMTLDDLAFSIPTTSGKIFAEKYMGAKDFKVYSETTSE